MKQMLALRGMLIAGALAIGLANFAFSQDPGFRALVDQGVSAFNHGNATMARQLFIQAETLAGNTASRVVYLELLDEIASFYEAAGRYPEAEAYFRKILALQESDGSGAKDLYRLVVLYRKAGWLDRAEATMEQVIALDRRIQGESDPQLVSDMEVMAEIYEEQGRFADAEALLHQSLALHEHIRPGDHQSLTYSLDALARLYLKHGQYRKAEPFVMRRLEIYEKHHGSQSSLLIRDLEILADIYRKTNRHHLAVETEARIRELDED